MKREFRETYRFEKWSSEKNFVFVDTQESEREREKYKFTARVLE